jgi:uncharacterized membrane protein required for colicin V production
MAFVSPIYPIDIAVVALLIFGAIQGYLRGLSGELSRLIATIIAVLAAIRFYRPIAARIAEGTRAAEEISEVLGFVVTLVGAILVLLVIRVILKYLIQVVVNDRFDKATGVVAGIIRTALFAAAALIAMLLWPNEALNTTIQEKSLAGAALVKVLPRVEALIGAAAEHLPLKIPVETPTETPPTETPPTEEPPDVARPSVQPTL